MKLFLCPSLHLFSTCFQETLYLKFKGSFLSLVAGVILLWLVPHNSSPDCFPLLSISYGIIMHYTSGPLYNYLYSAWYCRQGFDIPLQLLKKKSFFDSPDYLGSSITYTHWHNSMLSLYLHIMKCIFFLTPELFFKFLLFDNLDQLYSAEYSVWHITDAQ